MPWQLVEAKEFSKYAAAWRNLAQECAAGHPMLDPNFLEPALMAFAAPGAALGIFKRNGEVVVMGLFQRAALGRWKTFSPSQLRVAPLLVREGADVCEILSEIFRKARKSAWRMDLFHLDSRYQPGLLGLSTSASAVDYAETISVNTQGTMEQYWKNRSKKLRSNLKRYEKRLSEEYPNWEFRQISDAQEIGRGVEEFGQLERKGWKGRAGSAISIDNGQEPFYKAVMESFAEDYRAYIFEIRVGGNLIASRLAVGKGRIVLMLKTTYDEALGRFAPGRILLRKALESLFEERGVEIIEFYTNASPDQLQWATHSRMIRHAEVYRSRFVFKLVEKARALKRRAFSSRDSAAQV